MGPGGVGLGGATRLSSIPNTRTPAKRAGSSDVACRHCLIWDYTVFHVVARCRANPAMGSSQRNCRIAQRIACVPRRAQGTHRPLPLDEGHNLSDVFSACQAPYCATGITPGFPSRTRRSPPPPRARDLERVTPQPEQPAQRSKHSLSSTRPQSRRATVTRWIPYKSTSRSHRS